MSHHQHLCEPLPNAASKHSRPSPRRDGAGAASHKDPVHPSSSRKFRGLRRSFRRGREQRQTHQHPNSAENTPRNTLSQQKQPSGPPQTAGLPLSPGRGRHERSFAWPRMPKEEGQTREDLSDGPRYKPGEWQSGTQDSAKDTPAPGREERIPANFSRKPSSVDSIHGYSPSKVSTISTGSRFVPFAIDESLSWSSASPSMTAMPSPAMRKYSTTGGEHGSLQLLPSTVYKPDQGTVGDVDCKGVTTMFVSQRLSRPFSTILEAPHEEDKQDHQAAWEDVPERTPELIPDTGTTWTTHRGSDSSQEPFESFWLDNPQDAPEEPAIKGNADAKVVGQQQSLDSKDLPPTPGLECPGCRIGGTTPKSSSWDTPRQEHQGSLHYPEEKESGFCNACRLGSLLPDNISRFTMLISPTTPAHDTPHMLAPIIHKAAEATSKDTGHARRTPLDSKFRLGVPSESNLASRRQADVNVDAPPVPLASASSSTRRKPSLGHVAECLPPSHLAEQSSKPPEKPAVQDKSKSPSQEEGAIYRISRSSKSDNRPKPPRLSTLIGERSLSRSNAQNKGHPFNSVIGMVSAAIEDWEADLLKEYGAETPLEPAPLTPITPLMIETPRTKIYNLCKRDNGDF
ncbi:uncharacterized protein JN550_006809 [Neoarthrinium moseri]|uniref:uncharacterized protein n=1 Tax=Neoarthrinium moseri TaxID=1658444 RepID=UPI001FDBD164|nr:uncharacterized protein JN550_006809 [Neoarthrinium moseri]KAI1868002.1 hypothetical protein JN550_006809 [Neoarthrinium moseri]